MDKVDENGTSEQNNDENANKMSLPQLKDLANEINNNPNARNTMADLG